MNMDQSLLQFPLERILLLYDEAVVCLSERRQRSRLEIKSSKPRRCQGLSGLSTCSGPGWIRPKPRFWPGTLEDLYQFSIHRIYDADSLNDCMAIVQAIQVLEVLRSAWRDIRKEVHAR